MTVWPFIEAEQAEQRNVVRSCENSLCQFLRIDLQRGAILYSHSLDPLLPVTSDSFRGCQLVEVTNEAHRYRQKLLASKIRA